MANNKRELNLSRLVWSKKNRSYFEIIASMLEAVRDHNGAALSKYYLRKQADINSAQLKEYLEYLTEVGFIEMDTKEDQVLYRASEKGLDFLRQYYVLARMLLNARMCGNIVPDCLWHSNTQ